MTLKEIAALMRQHWPFDANRHAVLTGYRALGTQYRATLTDIALRNYVYGDAPDQVAEGRRRCALEIFQLANVDLDQLWAAMEKKPKQENRT